MNIIFNYYCFIFQLIIHFVKNSEIIQIWENEPEISFPFENNEIDINSYAFDGETGAELFLTNGYIIYNSEYIPIPKNLSNLISIKNPLIEYNSRIYFCSSYKALIWINESSINIINNKAEILDLNMDFTMKCLRGYNSIMVAYLGTPYLLWFNHDLQDYKFNFSFNDSRIFLAINNYTDGTDSDAYLYTSLTKDEEYFYFNIFKQTPNDEIQILKEKQAIFPNTSLSIYENVEIVTHISDDCITYLFSYNTDGDFSFYLISLEKSKKFIDGKYYFRFFNDYKIKYAKFIEKTRLLYYSIESLKKDKKRYIGIVDLQYYLLLFNKNENVENNNIYFNYGNYYKNKGKLFYFLGNKKISYCPFIEEKENNNCIYDYSYFDININQNGFYQNSKNENQCENKKRLGSYCVQECTVGFSDNGKNDCIFCNSLLDRYFFYKTSQCLEFIRCDEKNYINDNGICYNCEDNIDNRTIYYNKDCIDSCAKIYGEKLTEDTCISCLNLSSYFSLKDKKCVSNCLGEVDSFLNTCDECENHGLLYFPKNFSCVNECDFLYVNQSNICELCNNTDNQYYQNGSCVLNCTNDIGYGFITQNLDEENIQYCTECFKNNILNFLDGEWCSKSCSNTKSIVDSYGVCITCPTKYYVNKAEICMDECPDGSTLLEEVGICSFCENQFFNKGSCISKCENNQIFQPTNYINNTKPNNPINISYYKCIDCEPGQRVINNHCQNCTGSFYSFSNEQCYSCFCGDENENFTCLNSTNQCDCSSSSHYYGYSCEFYSEKDINNKTMQIISINNKLIKTSQNYFTYKLMNNINITFSNKDIFEWKVFIDGKEITGDKEFKTYFITSTNEEIFGINKELFKKPYNKKIELSLKITTYNLQNIFYDIITLKLINSFEYDSQCYKGSSGEINLHEMESNFILENRKNGNNNIYNGRYLSQYRLLDSNNEKIPITNFIQKDEININLICGKGFDINTLNDKEENQESSLYETPVCRPSNFKLNEIFEGNFLQAEKIFLLITYLKNNKLVDYVNLKEINDFINERIPKIINENGYYIDLNKGESKNISYSEPKLLFSLINNLALQSKDLINEENIQLFFNYTKNIFDIIFKNDSISNKTLSESDIKSLFRTIDILYEVSIYNNLKSKTVINNFIELFDNITNYLSFKTYPSETIRLIGKRISIINYHLGNHQTNISFPFIDNMEKILINDFLTYSYDNYYLNQEICSQKNESLLCFTSENYENLMTYLTKENYNLNDIILNIYLMKEINQNNELLPNINDQSSSNDISKNVSVNKNYSIIFKIFKKEKNHFSLIQNKDIEIKLDVELPFIINNTEDISLREKKNNIFSDKYYFEKKGWDIPLNPNNSEFTCIPKSYYENRNKKSNEVKYFCTTHFDYEKKKARCSCNIGLNDEILIIKDKKISEAFKHLQFKIDGIKIFNKYSLLIIYLFMFLLLIPIIYFLITDIIKDTKFINKEEKGHELGDNELKLAYDVTKKYNNTGIFSFSFYLSLIKFFYFSETNNFSKNTIPVFIKYLIIYIGFFIGIIFVLIPFYFIPFTEKQIFIDQRDINYKDENHKDIKPDKYFIFSFIFSLGGIIFGNIFIYIFFKILNYEKKEAEIYHKIKTLFKNYIFYEVKSEVLLGPIWKKIKLRINAYFNICGNFLLNNNENNKFTQYLKHISNNNNEYRNSLYGIGKIGSLLPNDKIENNINITNNKNEPLLGNEILPRQRKKTKNSKYSVYSNSSQYTKLFEFNNVKVEVTDSIILGNSANEKSGKQNEKFEKIRNRYIYEKNKGFRLFDELNEFGENKNIYYISKQINYSNFPLDTFSSLFNDSNKEKKSKNKISNSLIISIILLIIFFILLSIIIFLLQILLEKFGIFILNVWILPAILIITIANYIIYFSKILIGAFILFNYHYLRKKKCCVKFLFWIFVDKSMIYLYKIRNFITKYKKEFDYL